MGTSVQFSINYIADGYYDIRLNSKFKCLTRSTTTSNKTVSLSASLNGDYSMWSIETRTDGDYTYHYFRNKKSGEYLTWQNGTLQVVSSLPTAGTEAFYACSWRVAKYADYVEPTAISISNMALEYGITRCPTVSTTPLNADLCDPHDFMYTYDTSYLRTEALSGCFWLINGTDVYTKTVVAVHKPTGITTSFTIAHDYRGVLIGVDDRYSYHDHSSALYTIGTKIKNYGYASAPVYTGEFTVAEINAYLESNRNKIFVSRSHGEVITAASGNSCGTMLFLDSRYGNVFRSDTISGAVNYSNMQIVVFAGCHTGAEVDTGVNLPQAMVQRGAKVAIGFKASINCEMANEWLVQFFTYLEQGWTVGQAVRELNKNADFAALQPNIYGDNTTTLS